MFLKKKHEIGILDPISHHFKGVNGRHVQRRKLLGKLFQGTYFFPQKKKSRKRNTTHMKYTKVYDKAQFVAYNQIYKAGMEARKLKNYMNANGAAFFLDSSFDVFKKKPALNETENLFLLQKRIVRKKKVSFIFFFF